MAEGFARSYGAGIVNAGQRGVCAPTHSIARETVEVMQEKGIALMEHFPKDFEPGLAAHYDIIVNISGFELPPVRGSGGGGMGRFAIRTGKNFAFIRSVSDEIEAHVRCLIEDLRENGTDDPARMPDSVGQRIAPRCGEETAAMAKIHQVALAALLPFSFAAAQQTITLNDGTQYQGRLRTALRKR